MGEDGLRVDETQQHHEDERDHHLTQGLLILHQLFADIEEEHNEGNDLHGVKDHQGRHEQP